MKKRLFALAGALLLLTGGSLSAEAVQAPTSRLFAGVDTVQAASRRRSLAACCLQCLPAARAVLAWLLPPTPW